MKNTSKPAAPTFADDLRAMMKAWDAGMKLSRSMFPSDTEAQHVARVGAAMTKRLEAAQAAAS